MNKSIQFFIVCLSLITLTVSQSCSDETPVLTFDKISTKNYDKLQPPLYNGQQVIVNISVAVLSIKSFDEERMNYETDVFFHQFWFDHRLKVPPKFGCYENVTSIVMDNNWRQLLWTPDTYFKNSEDGKLHDIVIPYMYTTLDRDTRVFFAARLSLKLTCKMDLTAYPHDIQYCTIDIMSLQQTTRTVILQWQRFSISQSLKLSQFDVDGFHKASFNKSYKNIGNFSYLVGTIKLSRRMGYFMINKYIPSVLIVFIAFLSFWIPAKAYPARVTLSITSLLTIITQQFANDMPSVSYVIALNVWMMGCVGFVFTTLLEYAFVVAMMECATPSEISRQFVDKTIIVRPQTIKFSGVTSKRKPKKTIQEFFHRVGDGSMSVDRASRIIFPVIFIIFCVVYWIKYVMK